MQATHPEVRARLEEEEERLSPFAARSKLSLGRPQLEEESPLRTCYQRDRDRVIHSKSFRRLKHKTQVFIAPLGDHYRTRLTHTLEVSQIGRTVARALKLNEDLVEAASLAHDLGHAPFGHAGEEALGELLPEGFRHNEQSVRVIYYLENGAHGLNLTHEVCEAVLKHSKLRESIAAEGWGIASTLEGQIVKVADSLAYINHDLDDAIRASVIRLEDVPADTLEALGRTSSERINTLVTDIVDYNWRVATGEAGSQEDALGNGVAISLSPQILEVANKLREFLFQRVYMEPGSRAMVAKAKYVVDALFQYYCGHPEELPEDLRTNPRDEPLERLVGDHIAGMTDRYAMTVFQEKFVPQLWSVV